MTSPLTVYACTGAVLMPPPLCVVEPAELPHVGCVVPAARPRPPAGGEPQRAAGEGSGREGQGGRGGGGEGQGRSRRSQARQRVRATAAAARGELVDAVDASG